MEKSYLLLRNNRQLGPFAIDELLQQQLKPTDLIWVEGQSVAWCFPSQIRELNQDVVFTKRVIKEKREAPAEKEPETETVFEQDLEKRAEALRNRILSHQYTNALGPQRTTGYAQQSYNYLKDREIEVIYHRQKKYVTLPQLLAAGLMTAIIGTAFYSGWTPVKSNNHVTNAAVVPINTTESNAAKANVPVKGSLQQQTVSDTTLLAQTDVTTNFQKPKTGQAVFIDTALHSTEKVQADLVAAQIEKPPVAEPTNENNETATTVVIPEVRNEINDAPKDSVVEEEPKKKGFLRNLFKKKKKDKDEAAVE